MAGAYFELLTGQQGLPAKSFEPLEELKLLRRKLSLRLQISEPPTKVEASEIPPPPAEPHCETLPVSLETVVDKVEDIQNTLTHRQPSEEHVNQKNDSLQHLFQDLIAPLPENIFLGKEKSESRNPVSVRISQYLDISQGGVLETLNVGLTVLGIIGAVFGVLSFFRGWDGDLPLSSWICASGAAIIVLGLGGRFLASHSETKTE